MPTGSDGHIWQNRIDPRDLYRCPCGYEGPFNRVASHRKGWQKRPACAGRIYKVQRDKDPPPRESPEITPLVPAEPIGPEREPDWEYVGQEWPSDMSPEEIARVINLRRSGEHTDIPTDGDGTKESGGRDHPGDGGAAMGDGDDSGPPLEDNIFGAGSLPPGDWRYVPPSADPNVSPARETVTLPASIRVWYDWARDKGWHQGDGSLSAFIADIVFDHVRNCWGKALVVIDRAEVRKVG